ncbi:MAG: chorismate-binding protein [Paludibacteraceae bacterium]|nr:chorismate-binding protein [Paludibacteraceae bacterium]
MESELLIQRLQKESGFVLYRLPGTKTIQGVIDSNPKQLNTIQDLQGVSDAFIFAPFLIGSEPILAFSSDERVEFELNDSISPALSHSSSVTNHPTDNYCKAFDLFHQETIDGHFQKIVLARSKTLSIKADTFQLFFDACHAYPDTMVYLLHTQASGTWIGATPEVLLEGNCIQMHSVALAGTMRCNGESPKLSDWSEKNKEEQQIVADYVRDCIRTVGELKDEWGPYSYKTAHLAHLKSDIYFRLDPDRMPELLSLLHPTPAVCGIPKRETLQCIIHHEEEDRSYYAGFLGWYNPKENSQLYVNLRCLHQYDDSHVKLYAGGGILPSSSLEGEWMETENKIQTLLHLPSMNLTVK